MIQMIFIARWRLSARKTVDSFEWSHRTEGESRNDAETTIKRRKKKKSENKPKKK